MEKYQLTDQINSDLKGKLMRTAPCLFICTSLAFFAVKLRSSVATEQIFSHSLMNRFIRAPARPHYSTVGEGARVLSSEAPTEQYSARITLQ